MLVLACVISAGMASVTIPCWPVEPSSVVITVVRPSRLASIALNSRSLVEAPTTKSTRQPRTRSSSARKNSGATPYPPPTSRHEHGSSGSEKGRPSGPITSTLSWGRSSERTSVPGPTTSKTISSVPKPRPWRCWRSSAPPGSARGRRRCGGASAPRPARAGVRQGSWRSGLPVVALQRADGELAGLAGLDALDHGGKPGQRRDAGNVGGHRGGADLVAVRAWPGALRGVDDHVDLAPADQVDDARRPLVDLVDDLDGHPVAAQHAGGSDAGDQVEAEVGEALGRQDDGALVGVAHRQERDPLGG